MAKSWNEVVALPAYQALTPEKQERLRNAYFDEVLAPALDYTELATAREVFDAETAPPAPPQPNSSLLGDVVDLGQKGFYDAAGGVLDLAGLDSGAEWLYDQGKAQEETLTPETRAARAQPLFDDQGDYYLGEGFTNPRAWLAAGAETLGGMALPIPGGALAKAAIRPLLGLGRAATVAKEALLAEGLTARAATAGARQAAPDWRDTAAMVAGYGGMEGAVSGGLTEREVRERALAMPWEQVQQDPAYWQAVQAENGDLEAAKVRWAEDLGKSAGLKVAAGTAVLGAGAGRFYDKLIGGGGTGSRLRNIGQGGATETLEEIPQAGFETLMQNQTLQQVDPNIGLTDGLVANMLTGGALGGLAGGTIAGVMPKGRRPEGETDPGQVPPGTDPTTGETLPPVVDPTTGGTLPPVAPGTGPGMVPPGGPGAGLPGGVPPVTGTGTGPGAGMPGVPGPPLGGMPPPGQGGMPPAPRVEAVGPLSRAVNRGADAQELGLGSVVPAPTVDPADQARADQMTAQAQQRQEEEQLLAQHRAEQAALKTQREAIKTAQAAQQAGLGVSPDLGAQAATVPAVEPVQAAMAGQSGQLSVPPSIELPGMTRPVTPAPSPEAAAIRAKMARATRRLLTGDTLPKREAASLQPFVAFLRRVSGLDDATLAGLDDDALGAGFNDFQARQAQAQPPASEVQGPTAAAEPAAVVALQPEEHNDAQRLQGQGRQAPAAKTPPAEVGAAVSPGRPMDLAAAGLPSPEAGLETTAAGQGAPGLRRKMGGLAAVGLPGADAGLGTAVVGEGAPVTSRDIAQQARREAAAKYEARYQERINRMQSATTPAAVEAILTQEEYQDPERHIAGTHKVEQAAKDAKRQLAAEATRAEAEANGEWVTLPGGSRRGTRGEMQAELEALPQESGFEYQLGRGYSPFGSNGQDNDFVIERRKVAAPEAANSPAGVVSSEAPTEGMNSSAMPISSPGMPAGAGGPAGDPQRLPWQGASTDDQENRWYGSRVRLTAQDRRRAAAGLLRDGEAELVRVLNDGKLLEVRWPGTAGTHRAATRDYEIEVVALADNQAEAAAPVARPATPDAAATPSRPSPGRYQQGEVASREGQMTLAHRASRTALLTQLNDRAGNPYTEDELINAADERMDVIRDYLIAAARGGDTPEAPKAGEEAHVDPESGERNPVTAPETRAAVAESTANPEQVLRYVEERATALKARLQAMREDLRARRGGEGIPAEALDIRAAQETWPSGQVIFDVPGDGTFQVRATEARIDWFVAQIKRAVTAAKRRPAPERRTVGSSVPAFLKELEATNNPADYENALAIREARGLPTDGMAATLAKKQATWAARARDIQGHLQPEPGDRVRVLKYDRKGAEGLVTKNSRGRLMVVLEGFDTSPLESYTPGMLAVEGDASWEGDAAADDQGGAANTAQSPVVAPVQTAPDPAALAQALRAGDLSVAGYWRAMGLAEDDLPVPSAANLPEARTRVPYLALMDEARALAGTLGVAKRALAELEVIEREYENPFTTRLAAARALPPLLRQRFKTRFATVEAGDAAKRQYQDAKDAAYREQVIVEAERLFEQSDTAANLQTPPGQAEPTAKQGPFGPIFRQFYHDAQGAIAHLRQTETGEAVAALHHPEVGDIDLVWGHTSDDPRATGEGLAKLARWHPEVLDDLQGFIDSLHVHQKHKNYIHLTDSKDRRGAVRLDYNGQTKTWLLTAYEVGKQGVRSAPGGISASAGMKDATILATASGASDTSSIDDSKSARVILELEPEDDQHSPITVEINQVNRWVNALSDADYATLDAAMADSSQARFPYGATLTADPQQVQAIWEKELAKQGAKAQLAQANGADTGSTSLQVATQGVPLVSEERSNLVRSPSFFEKLANLLKVPVGSQAVGPTTNLVDGKPSSGKSRLNSVRAHAKFLGDILEKMSLSNHSFSGLDAKTQRLVLAHVVSLTKDPKVFDAIVELIPVDVMDYLITAQLPPQVLFQNNAVLKKALSHELSLVVSHRGNMTDALIRAIALAGAEVSSGAVSPNLERPASNTFSASRTIDSNHGNNNTRQDGVSKLQTREDDAGNVALFSKRPQGKQTSPLTIEDAEYLAAVQRGDMETARRLVDEAARAAGYSVAGWHGSRGWGFSVFKTGSEGGVHFGTLPQAEMRGGRGNARRFWLKMESTARLRDRGQFKAIPRGRDSAIYLNRYEGISVETVESIPGAVLDRLTDAQFKKRVPEAADSQLVKYAWQIKSADPITYDDNGQVIPLSQRFDPDNDDIRFAKSAHAPGAGGSVTAITQAVRRLMRPWANAPRPVVFQGMNDPQVDAEVRQAYAEESARRQAEDPKAKPDLVEGFYFRGKVYINAEAVRNVADLERVLRHETLGHAGLRELFGGPELDALLDRIARARRGEVAAMATARGLEMTDQTQRRQAAEEVLAELAQTRPEIGWVRELLALIKAKLREWGVLDADKLSDAEMLREYVIPARNFIERGRMAEGRMTGAAVPAFAKGLQAGMPETLEVDGQQRPTTNSEGRPIHPTEEGVRNFWKWFGDSKVVDGQGRPLVVYHGTPNEFTVFESRPGRNFLFGESDEVQRHGIFVTPNAVFAEEFSFDERRNSKQPMALFANMQKPLDLREGIDGQDEMALRNAGFTQEIPWAYTDYWQLFDDDVGEEFVSAARSAGFDGALLSEVNDSGREVPVFVMFGNRHQLKDARENTGAFDSSNPDIRFSLARDADAGGSPLGGGKAFLDSVQQWLGDSWQGRVASENYSVLGALTLRQLAEVGAKWLPGIQLYDRLRTTMETRRNVMMEEAGRLGDGVDSWARKHPEEARAVFELENETTLAQVDPSDYQVLMIPLKLGPGPEMLRNWAATEENVKELRKRARAWRRSKQVRERELAAYYSAAADKLNLALRAERRRQAALPELARKWAALSSGQQHLGADGAPFATEQAARAALTARRWPKGVVTVVEAVPGGWAIQELGGQQVYTRMRDLYKKRSDEMREALIKRIEGLQGLDEESKRALAARIRAEFENPMDEKGNPRIGPYFPLQRFGRFYVAAQRLPTGEARTWGQVNGEPFTSEASARSALNKRPDLHGVSAKVVPLEDGTGFVLEERAEEGFWLAESPREQRQTAAALEAEGWVIQRQGLTAVVNQDLEGVSEGFVAEAVKKLQDKGAKDEADMLYQMYLTTLSQMSIRKHFKHRKGTAGYSADQLRAFGWNMTRLAHQVSKLEHLPDMERALLDIQEEVKQQQRDDRTFNATRANAMLKEVKLRHDWVANPDNAPWTNALSALGFVFYLGVSPAAALVNLSQVPIVGLPVLAARYGSWGAAAKGLTTAFVDVARGFNPAVLKGFITGRPLPSDAANLTEEERQAFAEWDKTGARDRTQAHNLAGIGDADNWLNGPTFNRVMGAVSSLFHAAEVVNRDATLLAAYRLGRAKGLEHDTAVMQAEAATWEAHFDYANANRARMMQGNVAKVLLMFKNYSQHVLYFLGRNLFLSVKGESAEVKREARTKFSGMVGMTALFAGAAGLPVGGFFVMANLLQGMFGDDDEPWDAEIEFRNWLAATFPEGVSDVLDRGAVNTLTGLDFSSRVSIGDLIWRAPDRDLDGAGMFQHVVEQMLGPVGGLAARPFTMYDELREGRWVRAAEAASPKFLRDLVQSGRFAEEGVLTRKGAEILAPGELSSFELFAKAMGMNPDDLAVRYQQNSAIKLYEQRITDRRRVLVAAAAMAIMAKDTQGQAAAREKIAAFNRVHPEIKISVETLKRSVRAREMMRERAKGGIAINPKLDYLREQAGGFGEQPAEDEEEER